MYVAGLTETVVLSVTAMGVLGLFGSDDPDLSGIARRLDTDDDPAAIERRLADLEDAINSLVATVDLDRHLRDAPAADASSVEKAEALSRAVARDRLEVRPSDAGGASGSGSGRPDAGASNDATGPTTDVAARLRRERSPSSPAARQLLDRLASPERTDADEVASILDRAVTALDTEHALDRALSPVGDDLDSETATRVRDKLGHPDNDVTRGVRKLAEGVEASRSSGGGAGRADATGGGAGRADANDGDDLIPSVAGEVRRSQKPQSAVAKRLLDRLSAPGRGDLRPALETAAEQLDAASTTQSVVANVDRESVRDLADDVAARLDDSAGPVADALADRVADLRGELDRADESNAVIPYSVRHELRFYDRTLLAQLGRSGGSGGSGGQSGVPLDSLADRRAEVEDRYVEGRRDHNHSIPLHFLSLVDSLHDDAERAAATGDEDRAAGLCTAADSVLDHVEQLYERNEYSVMLRRLRG